MDNKRIEALNKISSLIILFKPLDEILERVMDLTLETTQTDAGSLLLKEENELVFKVAKGEKADEVKRFRVKMGQGIVGYVAESKQSLVIPDVSKDERFYKKIADDVKFKTYNIMATPIILDNNLFGVIEVINKLEKEPFTKEDLEILEVISHQVALLLENRRLKDELEDKARALRTLVDVGLILNACHEMRALLDLSMKMATKAMNAEASALMLIDELTNELVFEVTEGEKGEKIREIRLKMGEGIAGWVAQEGKPLVVKDVSKDERFASFIDQKSGFITRSIIATPLKGKIKTIGVIEAINKIGKPFDESEIEFFTLLANQVALAIENARLYSYTFGGEPVKEEGLTPQPGGKKLIGEVLKEFNLVTEENLQKALHLQKHLEKRKKIGEVLVEELKVLTDDALNCALSQQLNIPYVTLTPTMIDPSAVSLLPLDFMKSYFVIPIMKFDNELSCVMADPLNNDCIQDIERITGCIVKPSLGSKENIHQMLNALFGKEEAFKEKEETTIEDREGEKWLLEKIKEAITEDVSELSFEPKKDKIIVRKKTFDGIKEEEISPSLYPSVVFRAKMMGGLDVLKNNIFQYGKGEFEKTGLDISSGPSLFGEMVNLKLKKEASYPRSLFELLQKEDIEKIRGVMKNNGIVVLTGNLQDLPYSILLDIAERKIGCIEKEHKFEIENFLQLPITESMGKEDCLNMAILSSCDVIYIEEDPYLLDKILKTALEKLVILKTFYPSAKDAFYHLIEQNIDRVLLVSLLCGIIAFQFKEQKPVLELLTFNEKQKQLIKAGREEEALNLIS